MAASVPARRSLFKKPAWAAPSQNPPDTDGSGSAAGTESLNIFTRSAQSYEETIRQKERRRQQEKDKARRRAEREERRRSDAADEVGDAGGGATKRRRITEEDYARFGLASPEKRTAQEGTLDGTELQDGREEAQGYVPANRAHNADVVNDGPQKGISMPKVTRTRAAPKEVIQLSSDEDEESGVAPRKRKGRATHRQPSSPAPLDSDEDYPELAAAGRERWKRLEAERRAAASASAATAAAAAAAAAETQAAVGADKTDAVDEAIIDPVVKILVTSPLTGTKPLLVHRRLSQRFAEVRQVWCQRQGFGEERARDVFFVYKMRRIYDSTACKSLGIRVDADGRIMAEGEAFGGRLGQIRGAADDEEDDDDDAGARIHVVAVTEEAFTAMKQEKEREKASQARVVGDDLVTREHGAPGDEPGPEGEAQQVKIKVLLKAKGYKDYKLIVRPTTQIGRIIGAFKRENKLQDDREVVLTFDGERLEPEDEIQSTEIEDMDTIEVYVR